MGCNPKAIKQYREHAARRIEDNGASIRIRIARLATRTAVKWSRCRKDEGEDDDEEGTE